MAESITQTTPTKSNLGQSILSSVSQDGSGLDLGSVVSALVDAETVPERLIAEKAKSQIETSISAYGTLKGKVSDLKTGLASIGSTTSRTPFSDSPKVFVSVTNEASAKDFAADVTISQLAQSQVQSFDLNTVLSGTLSSGTNAQITNTIGAGTLSVQIGTGTATDIVISNAKSNNTIEGLVTELNKISGVGAEVIDTGSGVLKLIVKSETGSANTIKLSTSATNSLSNFRSDALVSTNMTAITSGTAIPTVPAGGTVFTLEMASNVLTVGHPGSDANVQAGAAGDYTFSISTVGQNSSGARALSITVSAATTDTKADLATKIAAAINTASGSNASITTTTSVNGAAITITATELNDNSAVQEKRAAKDALMTIDGVTVTRPSNVIKDLYPGHQMILTGTTTHDTSGNPTESFAIGSSNTTSSAKVRFEEFIANINSLKNHLKDSTAKGLLGADAGDLAGDTAAEGILRRLSSLSTNPIKGYGDNDFYLAELGVRTKLDGTLELHDTAAFDLALAANPDILDPIFSTKYSSPSSAVSVSGFSFDPPDVGSYAFEFTAASGGTAASATINGQATTVTTLSNGNLKFQSAVADSTFATYGMQVTVSDLSANISTKARYGISLLDQLKNYATDLLGTANSTDNKLTIADREFELNADITDADDTLAALDEKVTELTDRYNQQFGAMEVAVNSFKKTGEYMKTMQEAWTNQNK
jgi:flagellar hook-associated protein 2